MVGEQAEVDPGAAGLSARQWRRRWRWQGQTRVHHSRTCHFLDML
jgi:hypothetical protein